MMAFGLAAGWSLALALALPAGRRANSAYDAALTILTGLLVCFPSALLALADPQGLALAGVSATIALSAAIPVEVICDSPGIGQLAWQAATARDLPLPECEA
jgi:ABC-type dipeptide/oligopeptide/nickel transport system permease component